MYCAKVKRTTSKQVNLRDKQLPYTYQGKHGEVTIHQITQCSPDGETQAILHYQCGDGEIQTCHLQYHYYVPSIGVVCTFDPETDEIEITASVYTVSHEWAPVRRLSITNESYMYNGDKYTIVAGELFTLLVIKNGDIRNPIVVESIEEAANFGLVWQYDRDVPMRIGGSCHTGHINHNGGIELVDGTVYPTVDVLESPLPASYFFGVY